MRLCLCGDGLAFSHFFKRVMSLRRTCRGSALLHQCVHFLHRERNMSTQMIYWGHSHVLLDSCGCTPLGS